MSTREVLGWVFGKNLVLIFLLCLSGRWLGPPIYNAPEAAQGNLLSISGFLLAGALAGAFGMSYEGTHMRRPLERLLAIGTKFTLHFAIGLLFEAAMFVMAITPGFYVDPFVMIAFVVFLAILLHDFWDLSRCRIPNAEFGGRLT